MISGYNFSITIIALARGVGYALVQYQSTAKETLRAYVSYIKLQKLEN